MQITQARWRALGAVTVGASALMALYAALSNILRDTVIHIATLSGLEPELEATTSVPVLVVYWGVFGLLIAVSIFLAIVDLRYIRLQYLVEKREIFGRTVGDETFRRSLIGDRDSKKPE